MPVVGGMELTTFRCLLLVLFILYNVSIAAFRPCHLIFAQYKVSFSLVEGVSGRQESWSDRGREEVAPLYLMSTLSPFLALSLEGQFRGLSASFCSSYTADVPYWSCVCLT